MVYVSVSMTWSTTILALNNLARVVACANAVCEPSEKSVGTRMVFTSYGLACPVGMGVLSENG
jgi:hypothetical protein